MNAVSSAAPAIALNAIRPTRRPGSIAATAIVPAPVASNAPRDCASRIDVTHATAATDAKPTCNALCSRSDAKRRGSGTSGGPASRQATAIRNSDIGSTIAT